MGILSNAVSGLQASQTALRTTGHNISNANTEGYTRQTVNYVTRQPQSTGAGYIGNGVVVDSIERVVSEFLTRQLRTDTSGFHELEKFDQHMSQIDNLLAKPGTGLSSALQSFFAAIQAGTDDPSSLPSRQLIVSETESVASRFNLLYDRFEAMEVAVKNEAEVVISEINTLAQGIAEINLAIARESGSTGGKPNDLLDQRDEQLRQLSELVSIQVIEQGENDINVLVGNGQPLVIGQSVGRFELTNDGAITLNNKHLSLNVTDNLSGGALGGLLRFRDEILYPSLNDLGRVAMTMADQFNKIQDQGLDLDGDFGSPMFSGINDYIAMKNRVLGAADNALPNDREIYVEIDDTSKLTTEDYTLKLIPNSQNYQVLRNSDGTEVTQGILNGAYPAEISFDGITIHLESGSFQGGDDYLITPTRLGSKNIESYLHRAEDIAFASPIRTLTGNSNIGSGAVSAGEILNLRNEDGDLLPAFVNQGQLTPPVVIVFTSPTTYDVLDNSDPANPVHLDPPLRNQPFLAGRDNTIFNTDPGATLITGSGGAMGLPSGRIAFAQPAGGSAVNNGYPVEVFNFLTTDPATGITTTQSVTSSFNASAAQTAVALSNLEGVTANAFTEASITDINVANFTSPLQIRLNGEDLIGYHLGSIDPDVPDPATDEAAFNDYLVDQINSNPVLVAQGIYATSSSDPITGAPKIDLLATTGIDLDFRLEGVAGDNLSVNDGVNQNVRLTAAGVGNESLVTVGGRIDLQLSDSVVFETLPVQSQFFGDSSAADFAQEIYTGYQVVVSGRPAIDDRFEIEYNADATTDNRNGLRFVAMETQKIIESGGFSLAESYGALVEHVGTKSNLSRINVEASHALLLETQTSREAVSGVNLDEEAANLVKFEQLYNANARVISVARDLFDTLLNSV